MVTSVEVEGLRVAYERSGDGPPLVLAHGYVGDGATTWSRQLDALSDEFTVVAWDAPGAGASADPPEGFGMAGYADCLASFVRALGLARPHVGGISFGAALVLELSRRHPTAAKTLVLASGYAGWAGSLPPDESERRLQQALRISELPGDAFVAELLPTMFSASAPPADVDAFGSAMRAVHPVGFRAMARAAAENLRDALPLVNVPVLLIYGERDERAPRYVADDLHASIPHSKLVVLTDAGHVCNVEAAEQFNREMRIFLRDHQDDAHEDD
jgi:pimeloyl-ACP methyl ester carboxylesterase